MKLLTFCVILIAAQPGAQEPADCSRVRCRPPVFPDCPPGTVPVKLSPRPGKCCSQYECRQDCTMVKCESLMPVRCPADSVWIKGITPSGQCCPQPGRCECKPGGCVRKKCPPGYISVLVSKGSGTPGDCCNVYRCELDCRRVYCETPLPESCPEDSVWIEGTIPPGQCCPQPGRCECKPDGCVKKDCPSGYLSVLVSPGSGTPGDCCGVYDCKPDCTTVICMRPLSKSCPADSVWIDGTILPGQCCPQPGRCVCKPDGCVMKVCQPGYIRVLVSPGSGKPGSCCDKYECQPEFIDCTTVKCDKLSPPRCPEGTVPTERRKIVSVGDCCNPYECTPVCYTQWFDRDNPSEGGDQETLEDLRIEYPGKICNNPLSIQARTLFDVPAENTGQSFQRYDPIYGFICVNYQQIGECLDYKVRFGCPCLA